MSNHLSEKIAGIIRERGPITFERFMDICLYDPEYGYYTSRQLPVGREGDFYTSPHLHPVFGRLIGRQVEEMWEKMGRGRFTLVEMGAGRGYLAADMLGYLREREIFAGLRYIVVELNPRVREQQASQLREFEGLVTWVSSLSEIRGVRGCVLSNELLDAFPVHVVVMEEELGEVYVGYADGRLREEIGPLSTPVLAEYFSRMGIRLQSGYRTEVNLRVASWLGEIDESLEEGFVLTVDYGYTGREYYSEDRNRGTLMCYSRHQFSEDPLVRIGEQDITAHVDFSALKRWGEERGIKTLGYTSQGAFLMSSGLDEEIQRLVSSSRDYLFEAAKIKGLILPQGMGESHMVMIQYKGDGTPSLKGFTMRNRMRYL